ncbi:hypothetical protein FOZG_17325 [Fusarium oxysporum Fo47]|uniref:Uncharacterized protein n=1 Tax=Fusarium oxysporum Fo47 TaxID=660027 RepID=W9JAZ1_FUSOX|nr:hypothetical protein FOZG_17325 [Fusarium oxysporum Fo47]
MEIYWCIDKIFDEPVRTVFCCVERADQIREDSSFYQQVNHKLRSAGGTGLRGWIAPYLSWKRVTAVEFIKFLRVRGDWVIRDKIELPQSDDYDHNVGTPEGARMMILAEELIAGLHDPKGGGER